MKKSEKRTKTNALKRPYSKPQLEQVRLIVEEAVLNGCKLSSDQTRPTGPAAFQACLAAPPDILCVTVGS